MKNKRSKWTKRQDKTLIKLVNESENKNWDYIALKINEKKINKNSKQCRERWQNQLDPLLSKGNWSLEEKRLIFTVHNKIGNKWTEIADYFEGRTDHLIKNQFFSLIRRSLRTAKRFLKEDHQDICVNDFKPKVLCDFIRRKIRIYLPDNINSKEKEIEVNLNEYFMKFCFGELHDLLTKIKEKDVFIIKKSFDFLLELNNNYIKQKKIKKSKKSNIIIKKTRKKQNKFSKMNIIPLNEKNNEELIIEKFGLTEKLKNKNLLDKLFILEKRKDELNLIHKNFLKDFQNLVKNKINYLQNICDINALSNLMYTLINEISEDDFKKTVKKIGFKKFSLFNNESVVSQNNLKSDHNFSNFKSDHILSNLKSENNLNSLRNGEMISKSRFHTPKLKLKLINQDFDKQSMDSFNISPGINSNNSVDTNQFLSYIKNRGGRNFELSHFARKASQFGEQNPSLNVSVSNMYEDPIKNMNPMSLRDFTPDASELEF